MTNNERQQIGGAARGARVAGAAPRQGAAQGVPMAHAGGPVPPQPEGNGRKRTVLVVLGCVVAAIAVWLLIWVFACGGPGMFDPNAQNGQAPYKTAEEMQAELDRVVDEGMFNISIASVVEFADGASSGTAYIENVPGNRYNMRVAITDDASGEVLYESGVLQPNQYIEDIVLTKDLDAGTYDATATFTALDPTTYEQVGQAGAKISLNVVN